jgi:hypothetical protein
VRAYRISAIATGVVCTLPSAGLRAKKIVALPPANLLSRIIMFTIGIMIYGF